MAIVTMQKICVIAHKSSREDVVEFLQRKGVMEIRELASPTKEKLTIKPIPQDKSLEELTREIKEAITFLGSFVKNKKGLLSGFAGQKRRISEEKAKESVIGFDYHSVIKEAKETSARLNDLTSRRQQLLSECNNLSFFEGLNIRLCDSCGTALTDLAAGSFSPRDHQAFCADLKAATSLHEIRIVRKTKTKLYVAIFYLREQKKLVEGLMQKHNFNRFAFGDAKKKPAEEIADRMEEIGKIEKIEEKIVLGAKILAGNVALLQLIYDLFMQQLMRQEIMQRSGGTEASFFLEGWMAAGKFNDIKKSLEDNIKTAEVEKVEPEKGESPPVAIGNPPAFQPFETVTKLYGLPSYTEMDPTMVISGFFTLFFALCLSDAGYGIILAIIAWLVLKKMDIGEEGRKFFRLFLIGGIATFFIGAVSGGWFGIDLEKIPGSLGLIRSALLGIRLVDPMKSMLGLLVFSLAIGVVHVILGMLINAYEKIRQGDIISAVLDDLAWVYFILALIFFGITKAMPAVSVLSKGASYASLGGAIFIVLVQGRDAKNIIMKILLGLYKLYNITSYFGSVLSYSRLLALALTSAGIAMAINTVAGMVLGIPYVGFILMPVVWFSGHLINLIISVLSAFIHSIRLHYVEFYLQFFKGGGRVFRPFKIETEYVSLD